MVPKDAVDASGGLHNSIGMNTTSWADCFQCSKPGACTAIDGSDPYDQMLPYRNQTLSAVVSTVNDSCQFLPRSPYSYASRFMRDNIQSVACQFSGSLLQISIKVNGTLLGLQENQPHAMIEIDNYNVTWLGQSTTAAVGVGAYNAGTLSAMVRLSALQCCLSAAEENACQGISPTDSGWAAIAPTQRATLRANISVSDQINLAQAACDYAVIDESQNVQTYVSIPLHALSSRGFSSKSTDATAPEVLPSNVTYAILSFITTLFGNTVAIDNDVLIVR